MSDRAAEAVANARQSVTEYWTQLYADADAEDDSCYPIAQDSTLGQRYYYTEKTTYDE